MMGIFSVPVGSQRSRDSLNKLSYQKFKWCAHIRNFKRNLNTFLILALVQGRVIFNRCFRWSLEPVLTLLSTRSTIVTATLYPHTLAPIQGQYFENNAIKLFLWYLEIKHAMLWLLDVYNQQTFVSTRSTRLLISPIKQSHTRIVGGRPSSRKYGRRSTSTRVEGENMRVMKSLRLPKLPMPCSYPNWKG